jgi:trehalose 6-phosphate synthase/phosphatase
VHHFTRAVRMVLDLDPAPAPDTLSIDGREVHLRVSPMGIDDDEFEQLADSRAVRAQTASLRESAGRRRLILGVDRLDYTKGIPRRLLAFQRLLETTPDLRDRVRLVQVAVPSRSGVEHYKAFRRQINEIVGRVNGEFATPESVPLHYMYRSVDREELVALYCATDVMAVTPLRDGMNLVAKEFVASRIDEDGVLLLSELAGAAEELTEALLVNPFDIDSMADGMREALLMPAADRRARMQRLRGRVARRTVHQWAGGFVRQLDALPDREAPAGHAAADTDTLLDTLAAVGAPVFLLDYDGTLVPIVSVPDAARPDADLLSLLRELGTAYPVHVVSGRGRKDLGSWLEGVPATLWAEHGACVRTGPGAPPWESTATISTTWMADVRPILEEFTVATPGTLVEEKDTSLAWHYRTASDPAFLDRRLDELRERLAPLVHSADLDLLQGNKVVEVRPRGVAKSRVVARLLDQGIAPARVVAIGDDRTDEDMFTALPPGALTVRVGPGDTVARYRLPDPGAVRNLLRRYAHAAADRA